jgi:hypothetical protein
VDLQAVARMLAHGLVVQLLQIKVMQVVTRLHL